MIIGRCLLVQWRCQGETYKGQWFSNNTRTDNTAKRRRCKGKRRSFLLSGLYLFVMISETNVNKQSNFDFKRIAILYNLHLSAIFFCFLTCIIFILCQYFFRPPFSQIWFSFCSPSFFSKNYYLFWSFFLFYFSFLFGLHIFLHLHRFNSLSSVDFSRRLFALFKTLLTLYYFLLPFLSLSIAFIITDTQIYSPSSLYGWELAILLVTLCYTHYQSW